MAITLGSIGAALLAFAANSKKSKSPMHTVREAGRGGAPINSCLSALRRGSAPCLYRPSPLNAPDVQMIVHLMNTCHRRFLQVSANLVEIIALVLLPLAVLMVACKWRALGWGWTLLLSPGPANSAAQSNTALPPFPQTPQSSSSGATLRLP